MLALRPSQSPSVVVARTLMASVFGAEAVRAGGGLFTRLEARGSLHGLRVRAEFAMANTRRSTEPFTTIDVEEELDVTVYKGGAAWPYESWEAHVPFNSTRLANVAAVGAPRALLTTIAQGAIADRLAASGISNLTVGSKALRDGCMTRGVRLVVEGWPMDEAALRFLIDTALAIALEARRAVADGAFSRGGRHPEVVADEIARAASRARGLRVVAAVFATLGVLAVGAVGLWMGVMR